MKNNFMRVLSLVIALSLILSMGACGIWEKLKEPLWGDEALPDKIRKTSDGRYVTAWDYVHDPENKEDIKEIINEAKSTDNVHKLDIEGTESCIVYTFTLQDSFVAEQGDMFITEEFGAYLMDDETIRLYTATADYFANLIAADNISIKCIFCKEDGTILAEKEYFSNNATSGSASVGESSGVLNDFEMSITSARAGVRQSGDLYIIVRFEATNISDNAAECDMSALIEAYQGGVQLDEYSGDISVTDEKFWTKVKPGTTISFEKAFTLISMEDDIEIDLVSLYYALDGTSTISKTFDFASVFAAYIPQ